MIPQQLKKEGFRFILLKPKEKIPFEMDWQNTKNYRFDDNTLLEHINKGGNYGVVGGFGQLRILDIDNKELAQKIKDKLKTLTIKTGTEGLHFYFISNYENNHVLIEEKGELRAKAYQVVGSGCTHPNGNKYVVDVDEEIEHLSGDEILKIIKPYMRKEITETKTTTQRDETRSAKEIREVIKLIKKDLSKEEIFKHMNVFAKWSSAPPQYRELTYKKAQNWIDSIEEKKVKKEKEVRASKDIQKVVLFLLVKSDKESTREATEIIVNEILKNNKIHTIRDDNNTEIWIYEKGIYVPQGISHIKNFVRDVLENAYTTHLANEVIAKIVVDTYIESKDFFKEENIDKVAVENGIIDLKTKTLEPFTADYTFFNKLPIAFDTTKECPAVKKHFSDILPHDKDIEVMQELFGYLLLRDQPFEKSFMFTGTGRNGKGKTLALMKHFMGIDNVTNITLQQLDNDIFSVAELHNKLANLGGDISKTALKETGMFKCLVGRDLISAARKFMNRLGFVNYAKMVFCANELPITYDLTIAFFNRWILIDFPYTFLKQKEIDKLDDTKNVKLADADIILKLSTKEELSGLLNWALEGLHRLLENKGFSYSATTEETKKLWLRKSSSFNAFCMDCVEDQHDGEITKNELRQKYYEYCRKHKLVPNTDKGIKMILSIIYGVSEQRRDNIYNWIGIRFKESKGSKASNGLLGNRESGSYPIGQKTPTTFTTLTQEEMFTCSYCGETKILKYKDDLGNYLCADCYMVEK